MTCDFRQIPSFGVAGNFTGHLEQAGEARDFLAIKTKEQNAPKALFPTYIPSSQGVVPSFLGIYPFDGERIIYLPSEGSGSKLQIEPECAIVCDVAWEGTQVKSLHPFAFVASNDCSIRKDGARKISEKKNWGACSKGLALRMLPIDSFDSSGIMERYRIASFLVRGGQVHAYGEDSAVRDYSYIYGKLISWLIEKLNTQRDEGPAEDVNAYLNAASRPEQLLISIGATRYTDFGEHNFLHDGDASVVLLYPEDKYSPQEIAARVGRREVEAEDISVLWQRVECMKDASSALSPAC